MIDKVLVDYVFRDNDQGILSQMIVHRGPVQRDLALYMYNVDMVLRGRISL